ncbi:hypothetical protein [Candidatus Avelusimicrobium stercoris]|uniref:hypothetical protein n=1 Tax=Candidatus Avelusimicrobium stercoris TaxID=1947924 RepID=UPI003D10CDAC
MTILVILFLLGIVAVYAVFFLLFKVIWMILKKNSNKWPLILAGVATVLLGLCSALAVYWGVKKVTAPFKPIIAAAQTAAPVYGESTYQAPEYGAELTVYDGMTFSDWMQLGDVDLTVGIDTNAFKKDAAGKTPKAVTFAGIARQRNADEDPFKDFNEVVVSIQNRRQLEIHSSEKATINGREALLVSGTAYSNQGNSVPFWLSVVPADNHQVYYVVAGTVDGPDQLLAKSMVESLHLTK